LNRRVNHYCTIFGKPSRYRLFFGQLKVEPSQTFPFQNPEQTPQTEKKEEKEEKD
jgi:hypothetical protein